jgi:hypothetical protein
MFSTPAFQASRPPQQQPQRCRLRGDVHLDMQDLSRCLLSYMRQVSCVIDESRGGSFHFGEKYGESLPEARCRFARQRWYATAHPNSIRIILIWSVLALVTFQLHLACNRSA